MQYLCRSWPCRLKPEIASKIDQRVNSTNYMKGARRNGGSKEGDKTHSAAHQCWQGRQRSSVVTTSCTPVFTQDTK